MNKLLLIAVALLTGCATYLDPNYALQVQAYADTVRAQQAVELAKANADAARYDAMSAIAQNGDSATRNMAILALALGKGGGDSKTVNVAVPAAPESQQDKAYKWAALFAGPVMSIAQGYFGYRSNVHATDAQRDTSIASYNALGLTATAGFASNARIADAGFASTTRIGMAGFASFANLRPPVPSITVGGDAVIGGTGTFTGPYSGANSGNSGLIGSGRFSSPDFAPPPVVPEGP